MFCLINKSMLLHAALLLATTVTTLSTVAANLRGTNPDEQQDQHHRDLHTHAGMLRHTPSHEHHPLKPPPPPPLKARGNRHKKIHPPTPEQRNNRHRMPKPHHHIPTASMPTVSIIKHRTNTHHNTPVKPKHVDVKKHSPHEFSSRIVGGTSAEAGKYKFMVSWNGECGGSLIGPNLVLTAAHCAGIPGAVRIGSDDIDSGGETRRVKDQCRHPNYDDDTTDNDYLILELDQPVDINTYKPIQLNSDPTQPQVNEMLTVIGFGATSEGGSDADRLQMVQVPANSHATCSAQYNGVHPDIHLCAGFTSGEKDSCQGDSGGPIFEMRNGQPVQVGVVSFGDGCARSNKSGVYARVSGAYDWIAATMRNLEAGSGCDGQGGGGLGSGGGGGDGGRFDNFPAMAPADFPSGSGGSGGGSGGGDFPALAPADVPTGGGDGGGGGNGGVFDDSPAMAPAADFPTGSGGSGGGGSGGSGDGFDGFPAMAPADFPTDSGSGGWGDTSPTWGGVESPTSWAWWDRRM